MPKYHLALDGNLIRERMFDDGETPPLLASNKGVWLPEEKTDTPFNPLTQTQLDETLKIDSTNSKVVKTKAVRDKSADETKEEIADAQTNLREEYRRIAMGKTFDIFAEVDHLQAVVHAVGCIVTHGVVTASWPSTDRDKYTAFTTNLATQAALAVRLDELIAAIPASLTAIAAIDPNAGWAA